MSSLSTLHRRSARPFARMQIGPSGKPRVTGEDLPRVKAFWENHMPSSLTDGNRRMSPAELYDVLTKGIPPGAEITLDFLEGGRATFHLLYQDQNQQCFYNKKTLNFPEKYISGDGYANCDDGLRGIGLGRRTFRNFTELAVLCGLTQFKTLAADENGAYTWARFGFLPDIERFDDTDMKDLMCDVAKRLSVLQGYIPDGVIESVTGIIKDPVRESLWAIADDRYNVLPVLQGMDRRAISALYQAISESFPQLFDFKGLNSGKAFFTMSRGSDFLPLGCLLLYASRWPGVIDFSNARQMERVRDYCGGWGTLRALPGEDRIGKPAGEVVVLEPESSASFMLQQDGAADTGNQPIAVVPA